jgi:cobaltochelatase CobN
MPARVLLLSTADTELLAAHACGAPYRTANPARLDADTLAPLLRDADVAVLRLLGGHRPWRWLVDAITASGLPAVVLGGEAEPDAELMALSTVPGGVVADALNYLTAGGPANLVQLANFLTDTVLGGGEGFEAPQAMPEFGIHDEQEREQREGRPTVGIVFYRAHELSGNTAFVDTLADALEARGANALAVYCGSLRGLSEDAGHGLVELLGRCDTLVVTVLAGGGANAADASAGGDEDSWDVGALAALDIPVIQGLCLTSSREAWQDSDAALTPMDAAMQVAIPEFDGRLISVPFSFKETARGEDAAAGIPVYVADEERAARLAGIAFRHAALRSIPNRDKKLALVLSSYPTKHSRVGNAVGLDTPASAVRLLTALREAGYTVGDFPEDGDQLIHRLIAAGGHDVEWLTEEQLAAAPARVALSDYESWFATLPEDLREGILRHWGEPPGSLYVDGDEIVLASLRFDNILLMIQPPRGFGENPIAIYHDPDLPPSHHYLAAYRWLEHSFGADAVVHLGKHGTLEWLPGKGLGLSESCAPDAVLGELPLVYPFIVNDPGEGTQAKRRGHATVVDHLMPPMARADTYGDLAKLEQLLDEYATVQALDPDKTPAVRAQIWTLIRAAQLHHDLASLLHGDVEHPPADDDFDDFVLHLDGYLCEIKDVQIRDGLHILGRAPEGDELVADVLAILRAKQVFGGVNGAVTGLRQALAEFVGLDEQVLLAEPGAAVKVPELLSDLAGDVPARTASDAVDMLETLATKLVSGLAARDWDAEAAADVCAEVLGGGSADSGVLAAPGSPAVPDSPSASDLLAAPDSPGASDLLAAPDSAGGVEAVLRFAAAELVPRLARTTDEIANVVRALDGRYIPAGPSGAPTRGLVSVLPTGRNFYSVDPKAIPSRNAWDVGQALAESLIARHLADAGEYPRSVGLTVWGTSAMRTQGDDIAEILHLLGCRPVWDEASRRVTGFEVVPIGELGRPRIDVTVRISGFFRDAFPHVIALIDDAVQAVAGLDEPVGDNYVRAHADADAAAHGDRRRATTRIFGSKPGAYGAGLLPLIDARDWRTDADLAEVYAVWGGYAYGRGLDGREARGDMESSFRRIQVAAKNQDNREHDIVDSDDYFQ